MEKPKQAESPFSRLCDVAVIVKDLEKAIAFYQSIGIGPFKPTTAAGVTDRRVYGKPSNAKLKGVSAHLGPVELLLVQPVEGESVQKEFLDTKGEGIAKLGFEVDNLDREVAEMEKKGFKVISSGRFPNGGGFAYLDTRKVGGVILALEQK